MTEKDIQNTLYRKFLCRNFKYMFNNVYFYNWESDFLGINDNHYTHEFEIKISRSDFKADFKHKIAKHGLLKTGHLSPSMDDKAKYGANGVKDLRRRPNYFSYVVPKGLVKESEVPEYAGLYYVHESGEVELIRKGKRMQCGKVESHRFHKLLISTYHKFWNNQFK